MRAVRREPSGRFRSRLFIHFPLIRAFLDIYSALFGHHPNSKNLCIGRLASIGPVARPSNYLPQARKGRATIRDRTLGRCPSPTECRTLYLDSVLSTSPQPSAGPPIEESHAPNTSF